MTTRKLSTFRRRITKLVVYYLLHASYIFRVKWFLKPKVASLDTAIALIKMLPNTFISKAIMAFLVLAEFANCVKLLGILENFNTCIISIHPLEADIEIEDFNHFDFPISFLSFDYKAKHIGTEGYFEVINYGYNAYKWMLCSVQLIVLTKYETFEKQTSFGYHSRPSVMQNDYCTPNFGKFPRTNCAVIITGMDYQIWNQYMQSYSNDFSHLSSREKGSGISAYEYFAVFTDFANSNENRTGIQYICKTCFTVNKTILTEVKFTQSKNLRQLMEKSAMDITANGKNLIFPSTSYLDVLDRKTGSADFITSNGIFSFQNKYKNSANFILSSISPRSFYLNHRKQFPYIKILQSILFEHLPSNISEMVSQNYRKFKSKDEVEARTCTLDVYLYSAMSKKFYYVFDESFNFLTCNGVQSPRNLGIYIDGFHWSIWLLLGIIIGATSLILTLQYRSFGNSQNQMHAIYVISFILENSLDYIVPTSKNKLVYGFIVISLSITSIVIGSTYKAVITRDATLPVKNYLKYDKLNELTGFQFLVLPNAFVQQSNDTRMESIIEYSNGFASNGSGTDESAFNFQLTGASTFFERLGTFFMFAEDAVEYFQRTKILAFKEQVFHFLKDCSKKAFIGLKYELKDFLSYARTQHSSQTFLEGQDEFLPVNYYWQIPLSAGPYLHNRMSCLITSGIHDYWKSLYYQRNQTETYDLLKANQPLENNVGNNLGSLIKIFGSGILFSGLILLVEIAIFKSAKLRLKWQNSRPFKARFVYIQ